MLSAHSDRPVTEEQKAACRMRFDGLVAVYGFDSAMVRMAREYASGHKLATWQAVQSGPSEPPAPGERARATGESPEMQRRQRQFAQHGQGKTVTGKG